MKKAGFIIVFWMIFSACNNTSSVKIKIDSVGGKFDSLANRKWDSAKKNLKDLKEKVDDKLDNKDFSK